MATVMPQQSAHLASLSCLNDTHCCVWSVKQHLTLHGMSLFSSLCMYLMQSLSTLLHSNDVEVRAAAGEAIALLYHSCGLSNLDAVLESEQDQFEPDSPTASDGAIDYYNDLVTQPDSALKAQHSLVANSEGVTSEQSIGAPNSAPAQSPDDQQSDVQPAFAQSSDTPTSPAHDAGTQASATQSSVEQGTDAQQSFTQSCNAEHSREQHSASPAETSSSQDSGPQTSAHVSPESHPLMTQPSSAAHFSSRLPNGTSSILNDDSSASMTHQPPQHQSSDSASNRAMADNTTADASSSDQHEQGHQLPEGNDASTAVDANTTCTVTNAVGDSAISGPIGAKTGKQARGKSPKQAQQPPSRNPRNQKQQAEAISSGLDDVVGRMKDLAMNKGDKTRRSKKDRASLRSTFRELCNVVEVSTTSLPHFAPNPEPSQA